MLLGRKTMCSKPYKLFFPSYLFLRFIIRLYNNSGPAKKISENKLRFLNFEMKLLQEILYSYDNGREMLNSFW